MVTLNELHEKVVVLISQSNELCKSSDRQTHLINQMVIEQGLKDYPEMLSIVHLAKAFKRVPYKQFSHLKNRQGLYPKVDCIKIAAGIAL